MAAPDLLSRVFRLWVVFTPPSDTGDWVAHCLDMDLVTQGRSLEHAVQMAIEAIGITLAHEMTAGLDPTRRRAPQQYWDELFQMLGAGARMSLEEALRRNDVVRLAAQIVFMPQQPVLQQPVVPATWSAPSAPTEHRA